MSDATDDPFVVIATTAIPQVTEVRLHESTWDHIAEAHPEFARRLPSLEHAITDTIANPTHVHRSTTAPDTSYVYSSSNNLKGNRNMAVVVKVVTQTSARAATAMFRGKVPGEMVWSKGDE